MAGAFSRRRMMWSAGAAAVGVNWPSGQLRAPAGAAAVKKGTAADAVAPLNHFPRMVQEYFVRRLRGVERAADEVRASLTTKADAERYVRTVRGKIRESFGPFPEKTPLNARVTGTVERDAYRIEKLIFESRPGFLVTANLYVPSGRKFPLPGVVGTCGHSENGKANSVYQSFSQGLARQGYVVLIYDPLGQGERLQYPGPKLKSEVGVGVAEHLLAGNQQLLVGEFIGAWRAWDGIRALDYLLTRPEVDPKHVGVTGNSGGGTMTTWLCGVDERWTMAAPSCFVTTFRHNMENELPADTEQCPPRALALGLDHSDFIAAMAPKPVILLSQEMDFFDCRGTIEAHERLKRLYTLLGAPENIGLFIGPQHHGYSIENREAMYRWFNKATGVSEGGKEPQLTLEKDETLWCTPNGQVVELKSRPVWSYTRDASRELAGQRKQVGGEELQDALKGLLKMPARGGVPYARILRPYGGRGYPRKSAACYAVETEPGIEALVYLVEDQARVSRPPRDVARAVLYVAHQSADAELRQEVLLRDLAKAEPQSLLYACDVRGIGESRPDTCGKDQFLKPYGNDYFYAIHSVMLDYPYAGQKTHDLLCVLDWLADNGVREVHLAAKGWGAVPATFAAVLSPLVKQVTLKNAMTSYSEVAEAERYGWPLSSFVPGSLKKVDLPDCYRALEGKKLRQIEPWGAEAG